MVKHHVHVCSPLRAGRCPGTGVVVDLDINGQLTLSSASAVVARLSTMYIPSEVIGEYVYVADYNPDHQEQVTVNKASKSKLPHEAWGPLGPH